MMRVLPPSTAAFRAGSRVSGLGPSWTVKPVPSPVAASAASVVAVSALPLVSVVLAEEPQAARETAMPAAIAAAMILLFFMLLVSS